MKKYAAIIIGCITLGLLVANVQASIITPGFTFTVSDGFGGSPLVGTHFHSSTGGDFGNPAGLAEVGGFFGSEEPRGLSEYNLTGLVAGGPAFVTFDVYATDGLFGQGGGAFQIDIFAYGGNNAEDLSDYEAASTGFIGSFNTSGLSVDNTISFNIASILDAAILGGETSMGIRLQQSVRDVSGPAYTFNDFRLTTSPIPEPETYTMLLAGLCLLGFMAHRRKESIV